MTRPLAVVVEADGGSRGNPGNAAYGAVLKDATTGAVLAERGERIGVATNNVAEYRGLIGGLELYRAHADGAALEVRMDSKLVVEQMAGRWKIKHPAMRPLALQARDLAPPGVTWTWVPRERNQHADRLANAALDGPEGAVVGSEHPRSAPPGSDADVAAAVPTPPWLQEAPTTLVMVRHGETDATRRRVFSGSGGADPGLNDDGRAQVRETADWLAPLAALDPVVLASPLRRARESADILAARLDTSYALDDGLLEAGFGTWEGLTYAEVLARDAAAFATWLDDVEQRAGGEGDSLTAMADRAQATLERLLDAHAGRTVVLVSHLTPITLLLGLALDLPLSALMRTEVAPGSVTVAAWYPDGRPVVRLMNGRASAFPVEGTWH